MVFNNSGSLSTNPHLAICEPKIRIQPVRSTVSLGSERDHDHIKMAIERFKSAKRNSYGFDRGIVFDEYASDPLNIRGRDTL